jgi:hypothetical protein
MNLRRYIEDQERSNILSGLLISKLRKISLDEDFIAGVLLDVENDDDKKALLNYIEAGQNVNYEQIILNALWLYQQREKQAD